MHKILISILLFGLLSGSVFSQNGTTKKYHPPLGIPLILSSNFGELRPNHFHMGLDFKTNNRIGYNLYSIEKGHVSRIKVSAYGYGKVIYIDHPDGITSVYAHCSEFKGEIDSLVRLTQIAEQNYEVEIFPGKHEIPVKKGEIIGISGNTGGSTAPHLHFEIRDTKTEHALNPLLYGFDIADSKAPEIRGVKVYGISKDGYRYPGKGKYTTAIANGKNYTISGNTMTVPADFLTASGGLGFAFDVIDRFDAASNRCGLYRGNLIIDGDTIFGQQTDRIPFESTRYVNCHKDFGEYSENKRKLHKSFRTKLNDLPIYTTDDLGIFQSKPGSTHAVKYIAQDVKGNTSVITFNLKISDGELNSDESIVDGMNYLVPDESLRVEHDETTLEFGINTVYEPLAIDKIHIDHQVGDGSIPVHKAYRIFTTNTDKQDGKHYLEMKNHKGRTRALSTHYKDDMIVCETKYLGAYKIRRDTIPPTISVSNFSLTTTQKHLKWKISDNASGIDDYDLFIDGTWHLLEYEYKNSTITFTRPEKFLGAKELVLIVKDSCGNEKKWSKTITFK